MWKLMSKEEIEVNNREEDKGLVIVVVRFKL